VEYPPKLLSLTYFDIAYNYIILDEHKEIKVEAVASKVEEKK
jgi:hypothetical protein